MKNIEKMLETLDEEACESTGCHVVVGLEEGIDLTQWHASAVDEKGNTLLDPRGDGIFLSARGSTMALALDRLNEMCKPE